VCFLIFLVWPIFSLPVSPLSVHCRAFFHDPHRNELPTYPSVYGICLRAIGSFAVLLLFIACILLPFSCIAVFLLVISPFSIGLLLGVMLRPDLGL
jgi:hypothetical protein